MPEFLKRLLARIHDEVVSGSCSCVAPYFDFIGTFDRHFGNVQGCGTASPLESVAGSAAAVACS